MNCPQCGHNLVAINHEEIIDFKILGLKKRCWHVCTNNKCKYEIDIDKFKKNLFTV